MKVIRRPPTLIGLIRGSGKRLAGWFAARREVANIKKLVERAKAEGNSVSSWQRAFEQTTEGKQLKERSESLRGAHYEAAEKVRFEHFRRFVLEHADSEELLRGVREMRH